MWGSAYWGALTLLLAAPDEVRVVSAWCEIWIDAASELSRQ